jgi:hypothetical protein
VFHFGTSRGTDLFERDARIMSSAGGSATPRKIHDDGAERKCRNEGDKWWSRTPSFFLLSHFEYTMYFGTTI